MTNSKTKNSIPQIFDRKKIQIKSYKKSNIFLHLCNEINERIKETSFSYDNALELNAKINETEEILKQCKQINNIYKCNLNNTKFINNINVICDEELLPFKNKSFNLIFSIMGLNLINDLPGTFKQIYNCLKPNGFFIATFWGQGTLSPLAEALAYSDEKILKGLYPRTYPLCDIKTLGNLMQRVGFYGTVADQEKIIHKYNNINDILIDVRSMSENNILNSRKKSFTPISVFNEAEKFLFKNYSKNSIISIPYYVIFISGWKNKLLT